MQASMQMWIQLLAYLYITTTQSAFPECPGNSLTVSANASDTALTCGGYSATATWTFQKGGTTGVIGKCDATCTPTMGFDLFFLLTAINNSASRLDLTALATATTFGDAVYMCEANTCSITIVEPTTQPPTTTASPTTPESRDCDFCECTDCEDTGGCWGCILMICGIIGSLASFCISIYCCCCCCFCYCCCREKTKKRLERIYKRIDKFVARCLCKKKNQDKGPSDKPVDSTGMARGADTPPSPNCTKKGKQTAEKSDMNELRDIPSSPDQDEKSHPWKGSRDLPQPRAGGGGQGNVTHSSTPRSLLPVQAVTPLPSVERNSYAESRKLPLPSIDSKDAH